MQGYQPNMATVVKSVLLLSPRFGKPSLRSKQKRIVKNNNLWFQKEYTLESSVVFQRNEDFEKFLPLDLRPLIQDILEFQKDFKESLDI